MHPDDAWRWMVKGLGGIATMIVNHHGDPQSGACPQTWIDDLEKHADGLARVVREQKERRGETEQVQRH